MSGSPSFRGSDVMSALFREAQAVRWVLKHRKPSWVGCVAR